jgi:hypothetical protein
MMEYKECYNSDEFNAESNRAKACPTALGLGMASEMMKPDTYSILASEAHAVRFIYF